MRLVLGLPFYGRAYGEVPNTALGLFQKANPAGAPSWGGTDGIGFKDLIARRPERHGFRRSWHATSKVPWLYNSRTKVWISYDDARSIARKAAYARSKKLGGVAIWELSGDDGTLFRAVLEGLRSAATSGDPQ